MKGPLDWTLLKVLALALTIGDSECVRVKNLLCFKILPIYYSKILYGEAGERLVLWYLTQRNK